MTAIYEPTGAAREYSPLALNHIKGCDHGCKYCYVLNLMKRFNSGYEHSNVYIKEKESLLREIERSAKKNENSKTQVFLSFLTDPYTEYNNEVKITRETLEILKKYKIPVSILSKGGLNALQDLDLFKEFNGNIQIGASLTLIDDLASSKWEPGGAKPQERFESLKRINSYGIKTWASLEPVVDPEQSLEIMKTTIEYVDAYKIGKMNHLKGHENKIDWEDFLVKSVEIMRANDKKFYIKKDLLEFKPKSLKLSKNETDMDFLALKNNGAWGDLFGKTK